MTIFNLTLAGALAALSIFGCRPRSSEIPALGVPVVRNRVDSIISVLASPEKHYGRHVRVVGFAHFEFEGNALFLHREDAELRLMTNSIWLDRTGIEQSKLDAADDHYALVGGRFVHSDGHMGCCIGTITEIDTLERWPLEP